jgi:hypothetical protein
MIRLLYCTTTIGTGTLHYCFGCRGYFYPIDGHDYDACIRYRDWLAQQQCAMILETD